MLMMPYVPRLTRSSVPLVVALLVLCNVFVYFVLQGQDENRYRLIGEYYAGSVLPQVEFPAYAQWLTRQGEAEKRQAFEQASRHNGFAALRMLEADDEFLQALRAGEIVTDAQDEYADWRRARAQFDQMQSRLFGERFAFRAEQPSWLTAFSHQFLHGSNAHLIGNMVVLVLIAPAVEALVGSGLFLCIYLLGGLAAAAGHILFTGGAPGALVGASGAISAAMGAFAVLLGRRRIPFFYFVVVYFDVIRAPALLALPLWLVNELLQFFWLGNAQVAYGAHFGGLLAGALLAFPLRVRAHARLLPTEETAVAPGAEARRPEAAPRPSWEVAMQEARRLMAAQRFDEARRAYARAASAAPADVAVLRECFNVARLMPRSAEFAKIAPLICALEGRDEASALLVRELFAECSKAGLRLPPQSLYLLVRRFAEARCTRELEQAVRQLHAQAPTHPQMAGLIDYACRMLREAGDGTRAAELATLRPRPAEGA